MICEHCGKVFEVKNAKFCSLSCKDAFIQLLNDKTLEAVNNDPSHTKKFSQV